MGAQPGLTARQIFEAVLRVRMIVAWGAIRADVFVSPKFHKPAPSMSVPKSPENC